MKAFWKKVLPFIKLLLLQDLGFGIMFTIYEVVTEWGDDMNNFLDGLYVVGGGIVIASWIGGALFLGTTIAYFVVPKIVFPKITKDYFDILGCIIVVDLTGILGYVYILAHILPFWSLIDAFVFFVFFAAAVYGGIIPFVMQDWKRNKAIK
jgi:hypothetical protein